MAYLALLWKARTIEKYRLKYENEKLNSINSKTELRSTLYQKWTVYRNDSQKKLEQIYKTLCPEGSRLANSCSFVKQNSSFLLRIVIGIVGGFLTYFLYTVFVCQLSVWSVLAWTIVLAIILGVVFNYKVSVVLGVALECTVAIRYIGAAKVVQISEQRLYCRGNTLAAPICSVCQLSVWSVLAWTIVLAIILAVVFNNKVRCLVLLLIPGLFSRVGRYTLACYALVLILTGPAANTLKNLDTLSASLACGQERIKLGVKEIKESKDSPLNLVKEAMSGTIERLEDLAAKMKSVMVRIHRLTMSIAHVLQSSLSWLNSVELICNDKLGTPYEHCTKILSKGKEDCQKEYPEVTNLWNWKILAQAACLNLKSAEPLCVVGDFAKGSIVATVKKKLNTYSTRVQSLLATGVHIHRSHSCCNGSLPVSQAAAGVITDLRNRADTLLAWLSWTCALTGLFLMLIIFRAKYYLHMFRTRSRFDNRYVTKELRDLDLKRQRQGRETILPLNTRERAKYVSTSSTRLLPSEKMYLARSIVFMVITTLKLMIHMVADYSLYWVLMNVRFHGSEKDEFQPTNHTERILVSGSGPLASTVRTLVKALSVPLIQPAASTAACLPDPNPPDLQRYAQIGTLIMLLWLLAIFEPYGLRLRHVISGHYQPERAKARAVWLYYHIIRTRSCFLKYARRKLHRQFKYTTEEKFTFKNWLNKCIPCQWLRNLLRTGPPEPHCLLCYTKHRQEDLDRHLKRCDTPSCPGIYCTRCFSDIGQLCTICYSPKDYGDLSDVSLEKFTTDDSRSDVDDDDGGDNIPLIGRADNELEMDENLVQRNHSKKNDTSTFFKTQDRNDNQESTPLLDCNYLNKNYTQQRINIINDTNSFGLYKEDRDFPVEDEANFKDSQFDTKDENLTHVVHKNNEVKGTKRKRSLMVFKDTEVTVNGVTFPKEKLNAIVKIMTLLTTKDENGNKYKRHISKHNPYEYLVMEMFQPLERFNKMSLLATGISEPHEKGIRSLFDNKGFTIKSDSTEAIHNEGLQRDFNFKKSEAILKLVQSETNLIKKIWSTKRNVKRFLDVKKTITTNIVDRSKNFRINREEYRFTCKKRNRENKSNGFMSMLRKVFSNKSIDHVISAPLQDHVKHTEGNDAPVNVRTSIKQKIQASTCFVKSARHDEESGKSNNSYDLSTTAKQGILQLESTSASYNGRLSEQSTELSNSETSNDIELKTSAVQTEPTNNRKLGFWESLRVRKRRTSPHLFSVNLKKEPPCYNFFVNHKKRKKSEIQKDIADPKRFSANNDRNNREPHHLEEEEFCNRMAKYNDITRMESNEFLLSNEIKMSEYLKKEEQELQKLKHEVSVKEKSDKENNQKVELKEKLAEQSYQVYDKDNKNKTNEKTSNLKLSKPITQVVFPYKAPQRVAFSDGLRIQISDTDYDTDSFIQVKVNDGLKNKEPRRPPKAANYLNYYKSSDEDDVEILQKNARGRFVNDELEKITPRRHSKGANYAKNLKTSDDDAVENLEVNGKPPKNSPLEDIVSDIEVTERCNHVWNVIPKKPEEVLIDSVESDNKDETNESSDDTVQPCLLESDQEYRNTDIIAANSITLLDNFKSVQPKCMCNERLLAEIEKEAVLKLEEKWCHCLRQNKQGDCDCPVADEKYSPIPPPQNWCYHKENTIAIKEDTKTKKRGHSTNVDETRTPTHQNRDKRGRTEIVDETRMPSYQNRYNDEGQDKQGRSAIADETRWPTHHIESFMDLILPLASCYVGALRMFWPKKARTKWEKNENGDSSDTISSVLTNDYESFGSFPEVRASANPDQGIEFNSTDSGDVKLEYADEKAPKTKKNREAEKANQSTTTVPKAVADASTETSDWWSPMSERKPRQMKTQIIIEKCRPRKKSRVLVEDLSDTPESNHMLQSKRNYNQIYSVELMNSSRGSQSHAKKYPVNEKPSFKMCRPLRNKGVLHISGSKVKKKKDSSRNKINGSSVGSVIITPTPSPAKWQPVITEQQSHALKYFKCRSPKNKKNYKCKKVQQEDSEMLGKSQNCPSRNSDSYVMINRSGCRIVSRYSSDEMIGPTLLCPLLISWSHHVYSMGDIRKFPPGFQFGAATSAYQVEGAADEDGKSMSIWDTATHMDSSPIEDQSNGDVAADSYHQYERDVEMAGKELGLDFYRFSIAWTRILPNGFPSKINERGVNYYNNLINTLLEHNIQPLVTMYHYDLPQTLQDLGGWTNPLITTWFQDYANVLFNRFGDRVNRWITINDPKQICYEGYGSDRKAPFLNSTGIGEYICSKNVLLAHAKAYHLYDDDYRSKQNGTIGISIRCTWYEPMSDSLDDDQAAFDARQFDWGQYSHPIFSKAGDYPEELKHNVAYKSAEQGFPRSRLPMLSAKEVTFIRGSADFLGVNAYTTKLAYRDASISMMYTVPSYMDDMGVVLVKDPSWTQAASSWLQMVPWGLYKLLIDIKNQYDNPPVIITENGWSTGGGLMDEDRILYLRSYLNMLLDAIQDGCDIQGYTAWSLMDNFQWELGYKEKFGLYEVDFSIRDRTRTPRKSAFIYKEIIRSRSLDPNYEPDKHAEGSQFTGLEAF